MPPAAVWHAMARFGNARHAKWAETRKNRGIL
jgi:hypothetical protein